MLSTNTPSWSAWLALASVLAVAPRATVAFGPSPVPGEAWLVCAQNVDFLDASTRDYATSMDNCLLNPGRSQRCMQLCTIGEQYGPDASCVKTCQQAPAAPVFPTCQAACEEQAFKGASGVPACIQACGTWPGVEAYASCYNMCQVTLKYAHNTGSFTQCMGSQSQTTGYPGCYGHGAVLYARCTQIAGKMYTSTSRAWNNALAACLKS